MQRLIPSLILIAIQAYILYRLPRLVYLPNRSRWGHAIRLGFLVYISITIFFMIGNRLPEEPLSFVELYGLAYPFWLWVPPTTLVVFPVLFIRALITFWASHRSSILQRRMPEPSPPEDKPAPAGVSRRQFLRYATAGIITVPVAVTAYGMAIGTSRYEVHDQAIPYPDLPEPLEGLRIIQISDVHSNMYMDLNDMKTIAALVNDLPADLIVLTGDYVSGTANFIYPFCEAFQTLRRPTFGIHATLGNHDHWTDENKITRALTDIQFNVLRNRTAVLPVRDTHVNLIGIDYGGLKKGSRERRGRKVSWPAIGGLLDQAMQTTRPGGFNILLSHSPWGYHHAIARRIPLTLSGHTHGGQVVLKLPGFSLSPATFMYPYIEGLYRNDASVLYVNRGCGTTGPPLRINCKPEITAITLTRGAPRQV